MALTIVVVFGLSFFDRSSAETAQRTASEVAADCSGALSSDHACYQERYQNLVRDSGVKAALGELKDEYEKNDFVRLNCHHLMHTIGGTAIEIHGDVAGAYGQGDGFCGSGYYHGAAAAMVAKIGVDKMLEEADTICADLRESQEYSTINYFDCVHGLGHGFMGVLENELFESLGACDALTDGWERESCYMGVFMENIMAQDHSSHPSKYLKLDQPFYPCTDVEAQYKAPCYSVQTAYALGTQDDDFAKVFGLCATIEHDHRPVCYRSLGTNVAAHTIAQSISEASEINSASALCMLGKDYEARSNCVFGATRYFIYHYYSDEQARELCESFDDADLRAFCLQTAEEHYESAFEPGLEL